MPVPGPAQQMAWTSPTKRPQVMESYGKLPLSFEANQGLTDESVKYLARGPGYSLFLTRDSAVLSLQDPKANPVLRMKLHGANAYAAVAGKDELPGKSNYFVGSDPKQWRTNISTYAAVKYSNVYPGIDLIYRGNQRMLEYDFVLAPGADPQAIDLEFQGCRKLSINRDGALVIGVGTGEVIQPAPEVYQQIGDRRQTVAGKYVLRSNHRVRFAVAAYDRTKPLVIDPALAYSTYLGGRDQDAADGIAVDPQGNAYITGFAGSGYPITPGTLPYPPATFVTKLNAAGSALVYSTFLGGGWGQGIAVDASGNAYVTGATEDRNFPTTPGAFQRALRGVRNAFVAKLNPTGSALLASTYLGGNGWDEGHAIAIDASSSIYITGQTNSSNFPVTASSIQSTNNGPYDAFVTKFDPTASSLAYSTYLGGIYDDVGQGIAVDAFGSAYVAGATDSPNFPTTPGAFRRTLEWQLDAFVCKLNANGSALVYSTFLGRVSDWSAGIAIDASGNAYVTGETNAATFPVTPGAAQVAFGGGTSDAFVAKLNAAGSALIYGTYLGGNGRDGGRGIAVDGAGKAYVTGLTQSSNFRTTPGAHQAASGGGFDGFLSVLNAAGSALDYSSYLGGSGDDAASAVAVDTHGGAYIAGYTYSNDFPTTPSAIQSAQHGFYDVFVTKLVRDTTPPVIVPEVSGTLGNNGWYTSNVAIAWNVTDPESGISSTSGCGATTLTSNTPGINLTCSAINGVGLFNSASVTIMIDKSSPAISGMPPAGCSLSPPNHKFVQVADVRASDALSGLAAGSFRVSVASSEPSDPRDPDVVITPDGSGGFMVQLRADRLGSGNGRAYTVSATAMDNAGNRATIASTCIVPHDQGK